MDNDQVMSLMSCKVDSNLSIDTAGSNFTLDGNSGSVDTGGAVNALYHNDLNGYYDGSSISGWGYWQNYYYPQIIRESYPVYIKERAEDKGKKAFEIIKRLNDLKVTRIDTVKDFIDAMDALIKIL